jgi:hypothetical protein
MFSKGLKKHFMGIGSGLIDLHAELDAGTFLDLAIHLR